MITVSGHVLGHVLLDLVSRRWRSLDTWSLVLLNTVVMTLVAPKGSPKRARSYSAHTDSSVLSPAPDAITSPRHLWFRFLKHLWFRFLKPQANLQ